MLLLPVPLPPPPKDDREPLLLLLGPSSGFRSGSNGRGAPLLPAAAGAAPAIAAAAASCAALVASCAVIICRSSFRMRVCCSAYMRHRGSVSP